MTSLHQVRVAWTGITGSPGVSTFYFDSTSPVPMANLKAFFTSVMTVVPNSVTVSFPVTGMDIDIATGQPVGSWTVGAQSGVVGSGGINFSAASGGVINWLTGVWMGGRQLRGKTFIVPLATGNYGTDGKLISACTNTLGAAATTFATGGNKLNVWSRRSAAAATVTSATAPNKAVVLTSRRD